MTKKRARNFAEKLRGTIRKSSRSSSIDQTVLQCRYHEDRARGDSIQNKTREEDGIQNRHNPSVLREEDGAVEFRILAQIFRSEFTSSQQWSIRALLNYLQKGGGLTRDSSIVWIHTLLLPSYTFYQFKATLEENTSILHGKMTCCYERLR